MLAGIEPGKAVDTQQGGKKQRLKAVQQRLLTVIQQGKVVARMRVLMGLDRLRELGHHRARGNRPRAFSLTRASLAPIASPGGPPPVDMTKAHRKRSLPLGDLVEKHSARALRLLLEQGPQQGLLNFAKLSSTIKGWTCIFSEVTLAEGELHDFILLE